MTLGINFSFCSLFFSRFLSFSLFFLYFFFPSSLVFSLFSVFFSLLFSLFSPFLSFSLFFLSLFCAFFSLFSFFFSLFPSFFISLSLFFSLFSIFLSDPGIPGVRSMCLPVSHSVTFVDLTDMSLVDEDANDETNGAIVKLKVRATKKIRDLNFHPYSLRFIFTVIPILILPGSQIFLRDISP